MRQETTEKTTWKVGDLAGRTGLSVRTLHHYDEVGLLSPSGRTGSGHRLYSAEDVLPCSGSARFGPWASGWRRSGSSWRSRASRYEG